MTGEQEPKPRADSAYGAERPDGQDRSWILDLHFPMSNSGHQRSSATLDIDESVKCVDLTEIEIHKINRRIRGDLNPT